VVLGKGERREVGALAVVAEVGGEVGIPTELAALGEPLLERGGGERGQALAGRLLGGIHGGPHQGGRARQRLRFMAALAQILIHQHGDVRRHVPAARVRLPLGNAARAIAREQR
jgi:hypothetical protein